VDVLLLTLAGDLQHQELFEANSIDFSYQLKEGDSTRGAPPRQGR
jgi:hypothetical protein